VLVGALHDAAGSFTSAFGLLAGMAVVQFALARPAAPHERAVAASIQGGAGRSVGS